MCFSIVLQLMHMLQPTTGCTYAIATCQSCKIFRLKVSRLVLFETSESLDQYNFFIPVLACSVIRYLKR